MALLTVRQSTTWVRKEAERVARDVVLSVDGGRETALPDLVPSCLSDDESWRYKVVKAGRGIVGKSFRKIKHFIIFLLNWMVEFLL